MDSSEALSDPKSSSRLDVEKENSLTEVVVQPPPEDPDGGLGAWLMVLGVSPFCVSIETLV